MSKYGRRTKSHPDVFTMIRIPEDYPLLDSFIRVRFREKIVQVIIIECSLISINRSSIRQVTNFQRNQQVKALLVAMSQRDDTGSKEIILQRSIDEAYRLVTNEECFEALFEIADW